MLDGDCVVEDLLGAFLDVEVPHFSFVVGRLECFVGEKCGGVLRDLRTDVFDVGELLAGECGGGGEECCQCGVLGDG